ncbi:MAG: DUF4089 domain-containing protein [Cyanobacteria bacterium P01_A01_bin.105]
MTNAVPPEPQKSAALPEPPASFDTATYVTQTLQLLGLTVPPEQMGDVIKNFEQVQAIAQPVLDFSLPDELEAAPRFEPRDLSPEI